jgi:hypothetical protein
MPLTVSNFTGDGVGSPIISTYVELPDSGTTIQVGGSVTPIGGSPITVTGSPLTAPTPPVSGSVYWAIEVNSTTGAATVIQSTSSMPTVDPGNLIVFSQTLTPTSTNPAAVPTNVTPTA